MFCLVAQSAYQSGCKSKSIEDCFFDTIAALLANDDSIDDRFDGVFFADSQLGDFVKFVELTIDANFQQSCLFDFAKDICMSTFSIQDHRCHDRQLRSLGRFEDRLENRFGGLSQDRLSALVATGDCHASHQEPQIVIDFGDGSDGASRALNSLRLIDAQARLQTSNRIELGPFHLVEELPGVGREALEVLALTLGKEGVKGQRAFAAAAHTRQYDQMTSRQIDIDVFEVVRCRTSNLHRWAVARWAADRWVIDGLSLGGLGHRCVRP